MKQFIRSMIMAAAICIISLSVSGQDKTTTAKSPKWVSEVGYWVVESNIHSPLNHIVWFYNNDHVLVYKETLQGTKLNTAKKAVKMKLKKVLETSVIAWQQRNVAEENKDYVASILK